MEITPLEDWTARKLKINESLSIAQLQDYQLGKFRESFKYVKSHSRFYREYLRGIDPESIRNMQDVAHVPFTEPDMLAAHFNDFLCVSLGDISRIVTLATSGTTGRPKRVAFTLEDQELTTDFFHHGMMTLADSSDRVVIFMPGQTDGSVGDLLGKGLSRFGCESIVCGPIADYEHALKTLLEVQATCAVGIPSQLLALSRISTKRVQLKSVLLSTDYASQAIIDSLKQAWGCEVYDHYGMTEMGLGGAVECMAHQGYHLRDADLLFEIIDPVSGKPVADDEYGEVVFSTLTRRGMPLIRYRTGDRSRFVVQPCPCGSVLKRLERISGRINQGVALNDGSVISIAQLDEIIYRERSVSAYRAEIHAKDGCDCLDLTIGSAQRAIDSERIVLDLCLNPAIGKLVRQERLKITILEGHPGYFTTGTAKRFILDTRN
jgi:phenylacetate-CoA ligase